MTRRQMHLISVFTTGAEVGTWTHPWAENAYRDAAWWGRIAQTLERAKFDAMFFADAQAFYGDVNPRKGGDLFLLDPTVLAASIAAVTARLGLGLTVSTSLFNPYGIARSLGTLDVLSQGRVAWNVVTSAFDEEARRHGMDGLLPKDQRYDRADEVVEACLRLWNSFPEDAYLADKASSTFLDPSKLQPFEYSGTYVGTKGPISTPPSPQGHPVVMQAGSSPRGRDFAARWAEIIFTYQRTAESMQAFRADIDSRLAQFGRAGQRVLIVPQVQAIVGETEGIARDKREYLLSLIDEEAALLRASHTTKLDLLTMDPQAKIGDIDTAGLSRGGTMDTFLTAMAVDDLTVIEAARRYGLNDLGPQLVGTPVQVADQLEHMFEAWGNDGFAFRNSALPTSIDDVARAVVPVLQERGVFRTEYEGSTLREHLGTAVSG